MRPIGAPRILTRGTGVPSVYYHPREAPLRDACSIPRHAPQSWGEARTRTGARGRGSGGETANRGMSRRVQLRPPPQGGGRDARYWSVAGGACGLQEPCMASSRPYDLGAARAMAGQLAELEPGGPPRARLLRAPAAGL